MAINFNNQNRGIGTLDLSQFGLMQPQNTNMQTAGLVPEWMGGTSDEEDAAQNSLQQIQGLRKNQMKGIPRGTTEAETQSIINDLQYTNPTKLEQYQNIEKQIQDIKNQNKDSQQFKDIGGQTASLTGPFFGVEAFLNGSGMNPNEDLGFLDSSTVPTEAIYQDRIMNNNLPSYGYEPSTRFRDASNMAEYLQGNPQIMDNIQNTIGSGIDKFKSGLGSIKDFAIDKGRMGKNLIGAGAAKFAGLPGMVGSGVMSLLSGLGNGADYQKYTPGFDYSKFNPNMEINDFYDPRTKTNRFQRAKPGSFASARTGAEYFKARREKKAQDKINAAAATKAAEAAARGNYTPGGSHLSRGTSGGGLGLSQAQAQSVSQANKDAGYSSFSGLKDGGLASMFTRRR
jgi:hypothetical protein